MVNKITPGSNLLWEASRMMLPEHRELLLAQRKKLERKSRPQIDEQNLEELSFKLQLAYESKVPVTLTLFDEDDNKSVVGVVTKLEPAVRKIKIVNSESFEWVNLVDIVGVDL